jgi:taurine dioxygenase
MKVTPVSEIMGAEVTGVDLSLPMDGATKAALREAFLTYQVLVVRDQHLTPDQQVAFSSAWGDLEIPDNVQHTHADSNRVMILSNELRPDGW